jgi:hypothetical protein
VISSSYFSLTLNNTHGLKEEDVDDEIEEVDLRGS